MPKVRLLAEAMPRVTTRYVDGQTFNDVTIKRKGDEFDLPQADVERLLPHNSIELLDEKEPDADTVSDDYDDESQWSYADLQTEAKKRELSASGNREALVERLRADDATKA